MYLVINGEIISVKCLNYSTNSRNFSAKVKGEGIESIYFYDFLFASNKVVENCTNKPKK